MALTPSNMLPLGTKAPNFTLPNVDSVQITLDEISVENGLIVIFMCNHCPYVIHVIEEIVQIANHYLPKGIKMVAINSNDVSRYPEDSPVKMKLWSETHHFPFPYLFDENQNVAKAYDAACTPDFYLFNSELKLVYRGQMDDGRPGNQKPVDGKYLRLALDNLLNGTAISDIQKPSMGCGIKWKLD